jgi:hypothetical protein
MTGRLGNLQGKSTAVFVSMGAITGLPAAQIRIPLPAVLTPVFARIKLLLELKYTP